MLNPLRDERDHVLDDLCVFESGVVAMTLLVLVFGMLVLKGRRQTRRAVA